MSEDEKEKPFLKLPHRDDIPFEMAEKFVKEMQERYPGYTVQFAGDHESEIPENVKEEFQKLDDHFARCFVDGLCVDCGKKIPGEWPPEDGPMPEGWKSLWQDDETPLGVVCPECNEKDGGDERFPFVTLTPPE